MNELLAREDFRRRVFERDGGRCVHCSKPAQDVHHILERRLFADGGYYLDNGASLCGDCHLRAESTELSVEDIRRAAAITRPVVPDHLYGDQVYDKWGNPVLPNGSRLRGELFEDGSVQKILAPVLHLFTRGIKYPRTYHLPYSPGVGRDDRVMASDGQFAKEPFVMTLKMDGENTSMYRGGIHARSLDFAPHPSRNRVKALHASIAHEIPEGWRVCGENVYAKHSIGYDDLPGYFLVFSVWNERNECLSWSDTALYAELLGLPMVPVVWTGGPGEYCAEAALAAFAPLMPTHEGFVVRSACGFPYREFRLHVGKWVRENHVQTHAHWMHSAVEPNRLRPRARDEA